MNDVPTFPGSIRQRLEQAQDLLAQGKVPDAERVLQAADAELAKISPEFYAVVAGLREGSRKLRIVKEEKTVTMQRVLRKFLGLDLGEKLTPQAESRTTTTTYEFL